MLSALAGVSAAALQGVIYVLHVFQKKSKSGIKTPKEDKNRVEVRYKAAKQHYEMNKATYVIQADAAPEFKP